ncbi:MAG: hypothetical protein AMXMBFR84_38280 [Candidatus Hydrogenedentota bacterium]
MGFFLVMKAELVRGFIIMRRYWFKTMVGMIMGYGMLVGIIMALSSGTVDPNQYSQFITDKALGLVIGMFAFGIIGLFTSGLQGMARSGELEQMYMSPHGLITNFLARSCVAAFMSIVTWSIMIAMVAATFDSQIHASPALTVLLLVLTYLNLIGFGFMSGGLVLVFKQTGEIAVILRLILIGLALTITEDMYNWPIVLQALAHVAPITDAAICLKLVLMEGEGTAIFTHPSFYFLMINCGIWTAIGLTLFKLMENHSRSKGTLGAY